VHGPFENPLRLPFPKSQKILFYPDGFAQFLSERRLITPPTWAPEANYFYPDTGFSILKPFIFIFSALKCQFFAQPALCSFYMHASDISEVVRAREFKDNTVQKYSVIKLVVILT
jgi:hypothetical protein